MRSHFLDIMPTGDLSTLSQSFKYDTWPYLKMLCYAIAGIIGLIAGLRVYNQWNINGRQHIHIDAQIVGWVAAAIFLITATAFINMTLI